MENSTDKQVKTVMFDNAKELTTGGMKEMCNEHGISIFEWHCRTTHWHCDKCHEGHAMGLQPPTSLLGGGDGDVHVPSEPDANISK